jgi:lambda family phage minor tail protein L
VTVKTTLEEAVQSSSPGALVHLFRLDATGVGGEVYNFTPSSRDGKSLFFDGIEYVAAPIEAEGFEWTGRGPLPTPLVRIGNVSKIVLAAVITLNDLVGATLYRIRTFERFLDGHPDADPTAKFSVDVYRVERKTKHDATVLEWELRSAIDQEGRKLPGRMVVRDYCDFIYRHYDAEAGAFVYDVHHPCPYVGSNYFKEDGTPTDNPALDRAGKRLTTCCIPRFGENGVLPFGGYPGVGRFRARS